MGKFWNYFKIGSKVWLVTILASLIFWLFSFLFGMSALEFLNGDVSSLSVLLLLAYIVLAIPLSVLISGFVAKKLWKWN